MRGRKTPKTRRIQGYRDEKEAVSHAFVGLGRKHYT